MTAIDLSALAIQSLFDIYESGRSVCRYVAGMPLDQFVQDRMRQDAVLRRVEIMGEAANRTMRAVPDYAARLPDVPLQVMYGMRNRVAHGYDGVDLPLVWRSATMQVPLLLPILEKYLAPYFTQGTGSELPSVHEYVAWMARSKNDLRQAKANGEWAASYNIAIQRRDAAVWAASEGLISAIRSVAPKLGDLTEALSKRTDQEVTERIDNQFTQEQGEHGQ